MSSKFVKMSTAHIQDNVFYGNEHFKQQNNDKENEMSSTIYE